MVSSNLEAVIPSSLGFAIATDAPTNQISEGTGLWSQVAPAEGVGGIKGFRILNREKGTQSEQFRDSKWKAPEDAELIFMFYCTQPQVIILEVNGEYQQAFEITASDDWQTMRVPASALRSSSSGMPMNTWSNTQSIAIKPAPEADITQIVFADFKWSGLSKLEKASAQLMGGKLYLKPELAEKVESFWRILQDQSVSGEPIRIGGVTYARGLGVHADSKLIFNLDGQFSTFHVIPGPDDAHHGKLEMIIQVDNKVVYQSGQVTRHTFGSAKPLIVPVEGAHRLTLMVKQSDGNNGGDHANWAEAYLKR